jgi:hypothetical protein
MQECTGAVCKTVPPAKRAICCYSLNNDAAGQAWSL